MSITHGARNTASSAADSKLLETLARAGFIGYGVVHLLFAWLALQIAFGGSGKQGDQSGALQTLAAKPLGRFLVIAIIVGLVAMAIWQALEAAIGHRVDQGKTRVFERVASAGRTVVYLYLAWTAYKVISGAQSSSATSQQQTSEHLMTSTGGRLLVGFAGLLVAVIGVGLVVYGLKKAFEKHLNMGQMTPQMRQLSSRLGMAGYAAKGVAYAIAGFLLLIAAVTYDAGKARGLDSALRTLAEQSYGTLMLTVVALGIGAFGVFCLIQARYRKV
ncbi:MAG TPA: DUF1206 domain-containing protein [Catenuloplanes sp.]